MIGRNQQSIEQITKQFIHSQFAEANSGLKPIKIKPVRPKQRYFKSESEQEEPSDSIVEEEPEIINTEETITSIAIPQTEFDWLDQPVHKAELLQQGNEQVIIINAIAPGTLTTISENARIHANINSNGENEFDANLLQAARRLMTNNPPHLYNSIDKLVTGVNESSPYPTNRIWGPRDVSPNALRLYFTYSNAGSLWEHNMPEGIQPDTYCMVILGECFKSKQVKVLKKITDQSSRSLRAKGAGSI